ncbi:MAG: DUF222 domain-containing protein [Micrococcales bacterium]|nr:DUF222 domain-containing protein [Micrococcales bacterium]
MTTTATDPDTALDGLRCQVDQLLAMDPAEWTLDQLQRTILDVHTLTQQLAAVQAKALASFDTRGGAQLAGHRTTGDWLATSTRTPAGHAGWWVHTARALRDVLPETATALADGAITIDHVRAIRAAHRTIGDALTTCEDTVVAFARDHSAKDLRGFLDVLVQNYRPDDHDNDAEAARTKRHARLSASLDGWWHLTGFLDPATGAALAAALDVYADKTSPDDHRTAGNRTADALAEIAHRALAPIDRPSGLGHITLTLTPDQLTTGLGVRWPSGLLASRTDVHTTACSAKVTYVVGIPTDPIHWQPLAVGFAQRYATKAQRAALAVRDGSGCVYPGCTVPAHRCIAHHIRPWDDRGPTDLTNLVLVCHFHHRTVHHGKLAITRTPTGRYTTTTSNRAPPLPRPG